MFISSGNIISNKISILNGLGGDGADWEWGEDVEAQQIKGKIRVILKFSSRTLHIVLSTWFWFMSLFKK